MFFTPSEAKVLKQTVSHADAKSVDVFHPKTVRVWTAHAQYQPETEAEQRSCQNIYIHTVLF